MSNAQRRQVILSTSSERSIRPLVEDALRRELSVLEAGVRRTRERLTHLSSSSV